MDWEHDLGTGKRCYLIWWPCSFVCRLECVRNRAVLSRRHLCCSISSLVPFSPQSSSEDSYAQCGLNCNLFYYVIITCWVTALGDEIFSGIPWQFVILMLLVSHRGLTLSCFIQMHQLDCHINDHRSIIVVFICLLISIQTIFVFV